MNITRRGFFKIVGAATVATAVPSIAPALTVVQESAQVGQTQTVYGLMRESNEYDIGVNGYIVRHDIYDGRTQWTVNHIATESKLTKEEDLNKIRKLSADLFGKELEKAGVRVADLKKIPDFSSGPIRLRL